MRSSRLVRITAYTMAAPVAAFVLGWLASAGGTWLSFHRPHGCARRDPIVDRFMPICEVDEAHETIVQAPAPVTYAAALALDFQESAIVRAIFRGREILLRSRDATSSERAPFVEQVEEMGWGRLDDVPGRLIVFGAITKPWEADVRFHALPPVDFASFDEPGWVKIVWTLGVESLGPARSRFRTETRVLTTDAASRSRFRRYWAVFSPGILLIRREALRLVRRRAEHPPVDASEQSTRVSGSPARISWSATRRGE